MYWSPDGGSAEVRSAAALAEPGSPAAERPRWGLGCWGHRFSNYWVAVKELNINGHHRDM